MKHLFPLALALLIAPLAQAADVTQTLTITNAGQPVLDSTIHYFGLTAADVKVLDAKSDKFLERVKAQGKMSKVKGPYSIVLDGSTKGDDGNVTPGPQVSFDGLTLSDMNKIMRANEQYIGDVIGWSEGSAKAGKGKPWGK